jgi:hypothetical protein
VPQSNPNPHDVLLALATDLLAQTEAQQRTARRLEDAARQIARTAREQGPLGQTVDHFREQIRSMRGLVDSERTLLEELERELSGASN